MRESYNILVVDFEASCDERDELGNSSVPRDEMEIIEIGAVAVSTIDAIRPVAISVVIKPILHPRLTPFCTQLTGISQKEVDGGDSFVHGYRALQTLAGQYNCAYWASWGEYDRAQLIQDCKLHNLKYEMPTHLNLKALFSANQGRNKQYGLAKAIHLCGLEFEGEQHRALTDALNTARLLPWILGTSKLNTGRAKKK